MGTEHGDLVAQTFGPYRIDELIGRGGMGEVYRARQLDLGREVALKILLPSFQEDAAGVARFRREVQMLMALKHPGIVELLDAGEFNGRSYCAMGLVSHPTLAEVILREEGQGRRLAPERVVRVILSLLDALEAVHNAGIVHRDIKPANVFLDSRDGVIVADFGLAKATGSSTMLTLPGHMMGTLAYMAPEQCTDVDVDGRADLYAVGLILYRLLSGRAPFEGSIAQVLAMKIQGGLTPLDLLDLNIDPSLSALVEMAVAPEADKRYPTAQRMATALRSLRRHWAPTSPQSASTLSAAGSDAIGSEEPTRNLAEVEPSPGAVRTAPRTPRNSGPRRVPSGPQGAAASGPSTPRSRAAAKPVMGWGGAITVAVALLIASGFWMAVPHGGRTTVPGNVNVDAGASGRDPVSTKPIPAKATVSPWAVQPTVAASASASRGASTSLAALRRLLSHLDILWPGVRLGGLEVQMASVLASHDRKEPRAEQDARLLMSLMGSRLTVDELDLLSRVGMLHEAYLKLFLGRRPRSSGKWVTENTTSTTGLDLSAGRTLHQNVLIEMVLPESSPASMMAIGLHGQASALELLMRLRLGETRVRNVTGRDIRDLYVMLCMSHPDMFRTTHQVMLRHFQPRGTGEMSIFVDGEGETADPDSTRKDARLLDSVLSEYFRSRSSTALPGVSSR